MGEERYHSVTAATRRSERDLMSHSNETESRSPTRIFHSMLYMLIFSVSGTMLSNPTFLSRQSKLL